VIPEGHEISISSTEALSPRPKCTLGGCGEALEAAEKLLIAGYVLQFLGDSGRPRNLDQLCGGTLSQAKVHIGWLRRGFRGCGKIPCGTLCSAGILPASDESKGVAGWKPALRPAPKEFFRSLELAGRDKIQKASKNRGVRSGAPGFGGNSRYNSATSSPAGSGCISDFRLNGEGLSGLKLRRRELQVAVL
jgi:hypothetical protein